ncbi:hypothetical protein C8R43DRAFT_267594 [Mycena crocata]|nr:hypothetical protein C8R43DRAFT_267594 [Mycena crocata]
MPRPCAPILTRPRPLAAHSKLRPCPPALRRTRPADAPPRLACRVPLFGCSSASSLAASSRHRGSPVPQIPTTTRRPARTFDTAQPRTRRVSRGDSFAINNQHAPRMRVPVPYFLLPIAKARQPEVNSSTKDIPRAQLHTTSGALRRDAVRSSESIRSLDSTRKRKTRTKPFLRLLLTSPQWIPHSERRVRSSTLPSNTNGTLQNPSARPRNHAQKLTSDTPNRRVAFVQRRRAANRESTQDYDECQSTPAADESNVPTRSSDCETAPPRLQDRHDSYSRTVLRSGQSATSKSQAQYSPR